MPRLVLAWALWFAALFWVWMLLVGDWNRIELIAALCAAAVAATIAEAVRRVAGLRLGVPLEVVRAAGTAFAMVFVDFGILLVALGRTLVGARVQGRYLTRPFDSGPKTTPAGAARRAWTVLVAGYSPNAYVVDIDVDGHEVVLHDLVPHRASEKPA